MPSNLRDTIHIITGQPVTDIRPLSGGCIGQVYCVDLADGSRLVAKASDIPGSRLDLEGMMLDYLARNSSLPVPEVLHSSPQILLMTFVEGDSHFNQQGQQHAAVLLAELHSISAARYGFEQDTVIGSLPQPNLPTDSWMEFFRDQRLLHMGRTALSAGRINSALFGRLERLAAQLGRWLIEPAQPSLIHGDVWTTNILAQRGRITAFLDPAIYYADPEIELAFTTLFHTFDEAFYQRYHELRPIRAGFFEERRDLYNLYPLLVHARLFGGGYVRSVERILRRFGF